MASRRQLRPLTERSVARVAERLGVDAPGLAVARSVIGNELLYATWEEMQLCVAGPRRMKTTGVAIPTVLAAPGACLSTSNKPDLYVSTRYTREQLGGVWNFDPAAITGSRDRGVVVEPAQLPVARDTAAEARAGARRRVRRRLPAPRREARPVLRPEGRAARRELPDGGVA